jgi:hypothetical protein
MERTKLNLSPNYSYLLVEPEIKFDDDGYMFLEFEEVDFDFSEEDVDFIAMMDDLNVDTKVFNEMYLDNSVNFLELMEVDSSYPLHV